MDYRRLITQIGVNLGMDSVSGKNLSIMKQDIYNVLLVVNRKSTPTKLRYERTITSGMESLLMPPDFFVALDVQFFGTDNLLYDSVEIDEEEYIKWSPNIELSTSSFNELVVSATPQKYLHTPENNKYDGKIGYMFQDSLDMPKLLFKPGINGRVVIYYVAITEEEKFLELDSSPDFHFAFHEVIVDGVTLKWLIRRIKNSKSEIELAGIKESIAEYRMNFKEKVVELAGYANKTVGTPRVEPFNFLDDPDMNIVTGR